MTTRFCKWPAADKVKADAYNDECTAQNPDVGAVWSNVRVDKDGKWTVALLGPPWSFDGVNEFPEPASCAALRVDAEVTDTPDWPVVEEV